MKEIKCPYDLNQFLLGEPIFENTFPEEECEMRKFYGDCFHCFATAIAKRDKKAKNDNEIIHCKDCKYRDYWGDCTKWSKELDAHKSYILDENMFCGFAKIKERGNVDENRNNNT